MEKKKLPAMPDEQGCAATAHAEPALQLNKAGYLSSTASPAPRRSTAEVHKLNFPFISCFRGGKYCIINWHILFKFQSPICNKKFIWLGCVHAINFSSIILGMDSTKDLYTLKKILNHAPLYTLLRGELKGFTNRNQHQDWGFFTLPFPSLYIII